MKNRPSFETVFSQENDILLVLIIFVDVNAVEIQAVVGHLAKGFVVNECPAEEIFVFVNWKSLHGEWSPSGEWLVMDMSEPGVRHFIIKD